MISWRRFFGRWQNVLGVLLALFFVTVAVTAPLLSPMDAKNPGPFKTVGRVSDLTPYPPGTNERAILGTLPRQVDVFHSLVWGTRSALLFGLLVAVGAFTFGVGFGSIAGNAGGATNTVMMRISDAFLAFPPLAGAVFLQLLAASSVQAVGGSYFIDPLSDAAKVYVEGAMPPLAVLVETVDPLLISLILFSWMPYARVVNAMVLTFRQSEFVLASRALGAGSPWLLRKHLIPNSITPAIVLAARDVGSAVILQATMVVIGLGHNSPWGTMLAMGRHWITSGVLNYWWVYVPATIVMLLFGITWNLIGDGLNEAIAPTEYASEASLFPAREPPAPVPSLSRARAIFEASERGSAAVGELSFAFEGEQMPAMEIRAALPRTNPSQRLAEAPIDMRRRLLGMTIPQLLVLALLVLVEVCVVAGFAGLLIIIR